jgi:hypothetical protein
MYRASRNHTAGSQREHGRGASLSKSSIRVTSSHSPHHDGRNDRAGSSAGESRAASTAYGLRTPSVFAPVNAASARGFRGSGRWAPPARAATAPTWPSR